MLKHRNTTLIKVFTKKITGVQISYGTPNYKIKYVKILQNAYMNQLNIIIPDRLIGQRIDSVVFCIK
jgi:hypothetical protein